MELTERSKYDELINVITAEEIVANFDQRNTKQNSMSLLSNIVKTGGLYAELCYPCITTW